jgi:hypothetical protein
MRFRIALILIPIAAGLAAAAAPVRDLGLGLVFSRVRSVPADLPDATAVRGHPCVLDLRFAGGDRAAGNALAAWLRAQCTARTPVFVLANSATSPALLAGLRPSVSRPGLVILGAAAPGFDPDIALGVSQESDRRAYAALDAGAPVASLLGRKIDKPRNDEERLEREHLSDSGPDDDADGQLDRPEPPPPLSDAVLERAVQLHRALLALRRL